MKSEIKVHVINYGRKNLYMRYLDPVTGKQVPKSTGTNKRREAERIAAKWEHDLREGRYQSPSKIGEQNHCIDGDRPLQQATTNDASQ
jgi:hypothetical protein